MPDLPPPPALRQKSFNNTPQQRGVEGARRRPLGGNVPLAAAPENGSSATPMSPNGSSVTPVAPTSAESEGAPLVVDPPAAEGKEGKEGVRFEDRVLDGPASGGRDGPASGRKGSVDRPASGEKGSKGRERSVQEGQEEAKRRERAADDEVLALAAELNARE